MSQSTQTHLHVYQSLRHAATSIRALRFSLLKIGTDIVSRYAEQRNEASKGFDPLNLRVKVREGERSVQIEWVNFHYRNGKFTGATMVAKPKSTRDFDLATLTRKRPEWLHPIVIQAEREARPLREALGKLTEMEWGIRVIAKRYCPDALPGLLHFDDPAPLHPTAELDEDLL